MSRLDYKGADPREREFAFTFPKCTTKTERQISTPANAAQCYSINNCQVAVIVIN